MYLVLDLPSSPSAWELSSVKVGAGAILFTVSLLHLEGRVY